ncbi:hypothetical protein ACSUZJ_07310 [Telluria sp. B2]
MQTSTLAPRTCAFATVIIFGAPGDGKTRHSAALAAHYGKTIIIEDDKRTWGSVLGLDALVFTKFPPKSLPEHFAGRVVSIPFATAMRDAGLLLESEPPLFCIDCKHYQEPERRLADAMCLATACRTVNLVKGYQHVPCRVARRQDGACGFDGVHFIHIGFGCAGQASEGGSTGAELGMAEQAMLEAKRACLRQMQLKLREPTPNDAGDIANLSRERLEAESSQLALEIARIECALASSK